jgi:hypothetical protein
MKTLKKTLWLFLLTMFVWNCQQEIDDKYEQPNDDSNLTIPSIVKKGEFDIVPWNNNSYLKSTQSSNLFTDGGMAMIVGQFLPTVIIGNQRWTTMDFKGMISNPSLSKWDNKLYGKTLPMDTTIYYSYNLAMTLNNTPTMINYYAPDGLVERSNWRIPTQSDENNLHIMALGDETAINDAMNFVPNGMIYHEYSSPYISTADTVAVLCNKNASIHWNSEYIPYDGSGHGPYGTWHLTGANGTDYIYLFQFQLMMPYAPIRLVQDIDPL